MKKIVLSFTLILSLVVLAACGGSRQTLHVLNWGEYMDEDLIAEFETEFNVRVVYDEVGSNEEMEVRILTGTTPYDIAIPSDYMIDKLRQSNMLNSIDRSLLPALADINFIPDALALYENDPIYDYMIPYFWGTIGIIYNTANPAVVEAVETLGFGALFDSNSTFRRGMYDSPRDAVAAALLYLGFDVNSTNEAELAQAEALLIAANFTVFGEDNLKGLVAEGSLDMALVYSGDFFDIEYAYYVDDLEINFDFYAPQKTNVWIDGFVIPTTSENIELAHQFINFFLDIDRNVQNSDYVGYTPVIETVFDIMVEEYEYEHPAYFPNPEGSERVMYRYISQAHDQALSNLLNRVKIATE